MFTLLAFMAGPIMNTGQQVAYLQFFLMPYLLKFLCEAAYPTDPRLRKTTYHTFIRGNSWRWLLQSRPTHTVPKCLRKKKKPSVQFWTEGNNGKFRLRTYLFLIALSVFKVGCRIEGQVKEILTSCCLRELPSITRLPYAALSSAVNCISAVCFDSGSYPIGINTHVSCCMAKAPHLFEDLKLRNVGKVEGIKSGLDIKGTGTFKFKIKDDNGMMHKIKIPNSLYIPELRRCLLSPQHLVQEAKDNHPRPKSTRMDHRMNITI
jgi:hypothetical protein